MWFPAPPRKGEFSVFPRFPLWTISVFCRHPVSAPNEWMVAGRPGHLLAVWQAALPLWATLKSRQKEKGSLSLKNVVMSMSLHLNTQTGKKELWETWGLTWFGACWETASRSWKQERSRRLKSCLKHMARCSIFPVWYLLLAARRKQRRICIRDECWWHRFNTCSSRSYVHSFCTHWVSGTYLAISTRQIQKVSVCVSPRACFETHMPLWTDKCFPVGPLVGQRTEAVFAVRGRQAQCWFLS